MDPSKFKYSKTHEWVNAEDDTATIGITEYAQSELGEIVFVELPEIGISFSKGDAFGTIESYKTVSDLITPISGEVVEINAELAESPEFVNESPYEKGWMIKLKMTKLAELDELMTAQQYENAPKEH
ncbi:MAG: glycine cleavage system protein GcvH [Armatimonadetes bacterium]|jgi:glycine cleavage system H protein|nr:glycine cleavage system protein GcvH [Armatimonadota bacterium]